ncbi:Cross-pathway control protein A [Neolecta irregularis DAH-3]|uniref:Cross-pathway control protein A n=1 Tax=Neolecta irregularis (strain DAH-3) TaxID=1198029 RepID=A0A1U7LPM3_NEOID|nr:Cross-pathway control protein A [Neolecta irregularis DAH-3]|eukprot:OLL24616.1 Cross-pathway control protein A [Neolecta irregularis DAH-3]
MGMPLFSSLLLTSSASVSDIPEKLYESMFDQEYLDTIINSENYSSHGTVSPVELMLATPAQTPFETPYSVASSTFSDDSPHFFDTPLVPDLAAPNEWAGKSLFTPFLSKESNDTLPSSPKRGVGRPRKDKSASKNAVVQKRQRNTEAARRSRKRKMERFQLLEKQISDLENLLQEKQNRIDELEMKYEN